VYVYVRTASIYICPFGLNINSNTSTLIRGTRASFVFQLRDAYGDLASMRAVAVEASDACMYLFIFI